MKRSFVLVFACVSLFMMVPPIPADEPVDLMCLSVIIDAMDTYEEEGHTYVYFGGEGGRLYLMEKTDNGLSEVTEIGVPGTIRHLRVADLNADGRYEVVITSNTGELEIRDGMTLESLWEQRDEDFSVITSMSIGNVDQDTSMEIVILADEHLYVYDGETRFKEWQSSESMEASDILIGDVDGDEENEIVLSSGLVISSGFYQIEWSAGTTFGDQLYLFDVNNDGVPEIFARQADGRVRVFNARIQMELWE